MLNQEHKNYKEEGLMNLKCGRILKVKGKEELCGGTYEVVGASYETTMWVCSRCGKPKFFTKGRRIKK